MILRSRHARRHSQSEELNLTTFINLMVVLVSFLLATAVYSRIAVHELNLPTTGTPFDGPPPLNLTVTVRPDRFVVSDRSGVIGTVAAKDGAPDYDGLSLMLADIKSRVPHEKSLTMRMEPTVSYDVIIQVMDAARLPIGGGEGFPDISIGDAPAESTP